MPRKLKTATDAQTALPSIPKELIDQFVKGSGSMTAEAVHAASAAFKKALIERALGCRALTSPGLCGRCCAARRRDQPAQRQERQDGADRRRPVATGDSARPRRQLRRS